jgi:DNA-binding transcriptional regulator YiaG
MRRDTQIERELAERLQRARLTALNTTRDTDRWSAVSIARRIGVTKACLCRWENGHAYPCTLNLWKLWGHAVGVEVEIGVRP